MVAAITLLKSLSTQRIKNIIIDTLKEQQTYWELVLCPRYIGSRDIEYEFVNMIDRMLWLIDLGNYSTSIINYFEHYVTWALFLTENRIDAQYRKGFQRIVDECKNRGWTTSNPDPTIVP
jgi:hypothetical protein